MAQQDNDNRTGSSVGGATPGQDKDEFEDAVTTEISGVIKRAFGDDFPAADLSHIEVTDIDLSARPLPAEFELLEPGHVLSDRFEIVEHVHSGGMSHVYKALDLRRHRKGSGQVHVAIKTMRLQVASQRESRLSLEREASRAQRLSHPNIINIFDFDDHDGCFYLVMEWLEGESVNSLLKRTRGQRLDPSFAWSIIEGAAAAVQHAHLNNIVHADINPSNIFITSTHEIKLLDFGVARDCGDKSDVAESRLAWATQTYASPELLSGMSPVFEDDLFSLGCVAYRLLSGDHPFSGSNSLSSKQEAVKVAPISGLADDDWQTIRRCLDYERSKRPKSAAVFYRNVSHAAGSDKRTAATVLGKWLPVGAAVAALVAVGFWFWSGRWQPQLPAPQAETAVTETVVTEPPPLSPVAVLLAGAAAAMEAERYIEPVADNARDRYRQILSIDPGNPAAQQGLRLISDTYVRRAEASLRTGEPVASATALQVASETDPGNPAITLVEYLLISEGDKRLAEARAAAAAGDVSRTIELLATAEQYPYIDAASLDGVRDALQIRLEQQELQGNIAAVNELIVEGRLLEPGAADAHSLLLDLMARYGDDERLLPVRNRLGQRLLTSAAFATGAGEYESAGAYLDAVETLSIATQEVATARLSLQKAVQASADAALIEQAAATDTETLSQAATAEPADSPALPVPAAADPLAGDDSGQASTAPLAAASPPATVTEPPAPRNQTLSDLGIQRFVAPNFPRSARRRGLSGFVEVGFMINADGTTANLEILRSEPTEIFDKSAAAAVRQWRFEPRANSVPARIVLSFNLEP